MKLAVVYPKDLIKVALKLGFVETRQKGSHKTFSHSNGKKLTIPFHSSKPLPPGLLNKILKQDLEITKEELTKIIVTKSIPPKTVQFHEKQVYFPNSINSTA